MNIELLQKRKEVVYQLICDKQYVPMKIKELAILLHVTKEMRSELEYVLEELISEGKIEVTKRGKYKKREKEVCRGTFIGHPKGFGFVEIEGQEEDLFISEENMMGALHQDMVEAEVLPEKTGKRREGKVIKILSHGITEIVGTYEKSKNFGFVVPDNQRFQKDIFILPENSQGAVDGHKVVVEITNYGGKGKKPEGKVKEIIGHIHDPGTDITSIVYAHEIPVEFPEKVLLQAQRTPDEVLDADREFRKDLRDWMIVTIDGEDAKDLDDGVSLTKEGNRYKLGVHIADVTNYVQENSALDREALKRGTSVYLTDRVIPMLPHKLSNGICSLNEGKDRLALSCLMDIDEKGNVIGHQICQTVIRVKKRMTYTSVNKILEECEEQEIQKYEDFVPMLQDMAELAGILRKKRRQRGSIDFDFPETKISLDEKGRPVAIGPYERNTATKLIEDFMLIANETVAEDYFWQEVPFLYRTHENPDPERIQKLSRFIQNFGYSIKNTKEEIHPKELQKLLAKIEDSPEEDLISRLTLRSLKQAKYTVECTGHFGLAAKYYCHFTSPIRRYPDLQIHRIIKESLRGKLNEQRIEHYERILPEVAQQCSRLERRADEAERETEKMKKAQYMQERIGEIYEGVISSITSWGVYVELPNTIEGMIHVSNMWDDTYYYREETMEMVGAEFGRIYSLGQKVTVKVIGADPEARTVDFCFSMS